jgi:hypothetical protein
VCYTKIMKKLLLILPIIALIFGFSFSVDRAEAAVRSRGYFKSSGTYVQPYYRSSPNRSVFDNYSTKGNYNPYTGRIGTKSPYKW